MLAHNSIQPSLSGVLGNMTRNIFKSNFASIWAINVSQLNGNILIHNKKERDKIVFNSIKKRLLLCFEADISFK